MSDKAAAATWTVTLAFISAGLAAHATGSFSAGGAVFFGLWATAGINETTK
jgi:hypothetical protein